ncbi:MAG: MarR family winged helix-turn-helix transcriptional regulator [Hyphococcus sp.]
MSKSAPASAPGLADDPVLFKVMTEIDMIAHMAAVEFERLLPDDMTQAQFGVINRLLRLDAAETVSELAEAFRVAQPTMSSTVKKLAAKGYVDIIPDTEDKRVKRIRATRAGKAVRAKAIRALDPHWAAFAEDAPEAVKRADWPKLLKTLTAMRDFMERRRT